MDQEEEPGDFQLTHNPSHGNVDQSQPIDAAQEEQHRHVEGRLQGMYLQNEGSQQLALARQEVALIVRELASSGVAAGPINIHFAPQFVQQTQYQDKRRNMHFENVGGDVHNPGGEVYGNIGQPGEPTIQRTPQNIAKQPGSSQLLVQEPTIQRTPQNIAEQPGPSQAPVQEPTIQGTPQNITEQPGPSQAPVQEDFQHREIIRRLEKYQDKCYRRSKALELLRVYEQIRPINDEQLTTYAAELFPDWLSLSDIKLTESQIDSLLFILIKVEKRIGLLHLCDCFSKPEDVGRLFEAIQPMPGKIGWLNISGNIIPKIPSKSFFNKIEDYLFMWKCFPDDDAIDGKRGSNQSEIAEIQRVFDQLNDSKLEVDLGRCDGKFVKLRSRKKSDVSG